MLMEEIVPLDQDHLASKNGDDLISILSTESQEKNDSDNQDSSSEEEEIKITPKPAKPRKTRNSLVASIGLGGLDPVKVTEAALNYFNENKLREEEMKERKRKEEEERIELEKKKKVEKLLKREQRAKKQQEKLEKLKLAAENASPISVSDNGTNGSNKIKLESLSEPEEPNASDDSDNKPIAVSIIKPSKPVINIKKMKAQSGEDQQKISMPPKKTIKRKKMNELDDRPVEERPKKKLKKIKEEPQKQETKLKRSFKNKDKIYSDETSDNSRKKNSKAEHSDVELPSKSKWQLIEEDLQAGDTLTLYWKKYLFDNLKKQAKVQAFRAIDRGWGYPEAHYKNQIRPKFAKPLYNLKQIQNNHQIIEPSPLCKGRKDFTIPKNIPSYTQDNVALKTNMNSSDQSADDEKRNIRKIQHPKKRLIYYSKREIDRDRGNNYQNESNNKNEL